MYKDLKTRKILSYRIQTQVSKHEIRNVRPTFKASNVRSMFKASNPDRSKTQNAISVFKPSNSRFALKISNTKQHFKISKREVCVQNLKRKIHVLEHESLETRDEDHSFKEVEGVKTLRIFQKE